MKHGAIGSSFVSAAAPVYGDEICQLVEFTPSAPTQILNFDLDGRTPNLILFTTTGATIENPVSTYTLESADENVCFGAWTPSAQGYLINASAQGVATKVERSGNSNSEVIAIAAPGVATIEASAAVSSVGDDTFTLTWTGTPTRAARIRAVAFSITDAAYVHKVGTPDGPSVDTLGFFTEAFVAWGNNSEFQNPHPLNGYVAGGGFTIGSGVAPASQSSVGFTDSNGIAADFRGGPQVNSARSSSRSIYVRNDTGSESIRRVSAMTSTQITWDRDAGQIHNYVSDWAYVALNINNAGADYQELAVGPSFDQSVNVGFRPGILLCSWGNTRFEHISGTETFDNKVNISHGYVFDDGANGIQKVHHWGHRFNATPSDYTQADYVEGFPARDNQHNPFDATRMMVVTLEPTGYRVQAGSASSGTTYFRIIALNIEKVL